MTLDRRVSNAARDLQRFASAYSHGYGMLAESAGQSRLPSPLGRGLTTVMELLPDGTVEEYGVRTRSTNPPDSAPPQGGDDDLRSHLIRAAQHLGAAIRELFLAWEWPDLTAWEPLQLAYTVERQGELLASCDNTGRVCWRPTDDFTTPVLYPADVERGVSQLRGLLAQLETIDWDEADQADAQVVESCLGFTEAAIKALRGAGVWERPEQPPVCKVRGCWKECEKGRGEAYRDTCPGHRKRQAA